MSVIVLNRSDWPTPALKVLARWVARREGVGVARHYTFIFRATRRRDYYRGTAHRYEQTVTLHRRFQPREGGWPLVRKDHRFKWSTEEVYRSRLEFLVGIMAHEARHATLGSADAFRRNGRIDRAAMEFRCNQAAAEAVKAFREAWAGLKVRIRLSLRAARKKEQVRLERKALRRADPGPKLLHAQAMVDRWQSRLKLANTKVKRYRQKVRYYEG